MMGEVLWILVILYFSFLLLFSSLFFSSPGTGRVLSRVSQLIDTFLLGYRRWEEERGDSE